MPPKRCKKVADILDKVLDTASLPHSVDVGSLKQQIEEQIRVLNVRAPVKQFGKGDSVESRRLVILQLLLKASKHDVPLSTQTLASAVGMKAAAFETLSNKASHHIDVSSESRKRRSRSASSFQSAADSATTVAEAVKSTIPALSIRLGAQVHDSHGYARRAQQLLTDIEVFVSSTPTISAQKKRGYLQDMQRSRAAYEAACFYLTARGKKMRKSTSRNSSDVAEQEEEDTQLSIQDIIDASNSVSVSEFRDILPTVEEFAEEIENTGRQRKVAASSNQSGGTKRKRGKPQTKARGQEGSSERDGVAAQALLECAESAARTGMNNQRASLVMDTTPKFVYSPRFLEWKRRVLEETCDREKQQADEEVANVASISDLDAVQRAANAVLRRNGLLH